MGQFQVTADAGTSRPGLFVVSTGRCGSTMLSNMLRLNPEILSLSEFLAHLVHDPLPPGELDAASYWRLLSEPRPYLMQPYRLGLHVPEFLYRPGPDSRFTAATGIPPIMITTLPHLSDDPEGLYDELEAFVSGLTPASVAVWHRRLFEWLCDRAGARVWVERSGSVQYLGQLVDLFSEAKFVHLYRDGRECAYSMSRHARYRLAALTTMMLLSLGMSPYLTDDPPPEQVPPELVPFMPDTFDREAFEQYEWPVAEFGHFWSDMNLTALEVLAGLPSERVLQLSYEDLVAQPRPTLQRLARFAGLPGADPGWLDQAVRLAQARSPGWPTLSEAQIDELNRACEPAMQRLYGETCRHG